MAKESSKKSLAARLQLLTKSQQELVDIVIDQLLRPIQITQDIPQEPFNSEFARIFGEALQLHHTLSDRPLSKENFEYVMIRVVRMAGQSAIHGKSGFAGHDVEINSQKFSLKTQADRSIKRSIIHISKFMELGKGDWIDESSLVGQRDRFLNHLEGYGRILTLRYFRTPPKRDLPVISHEYELVEIPKPLLLEAATGVITMQHDSKQNPKPGYCRVFDSAGTIKYALYFDGGSERKLQIKALDKARCQVLAVWTFDA